MILNIVIEEHRVPVEVPDHLLDEAEDFFAKMDADMDRGYQMSRTWVENPDVVQRCQIAADKLYTALHSHNDQLSQLMAAYILKRLPGVATVYINTEGDMMEHELAR